MFAILTDSKRRVTSARPVTLARFRENLQGLGWTFIDGTSFMTAADVADFMAMPTDYLLDVTGYIFKDYGNIDNDMSQFTDPWS